MDPQTYYLNQGILGVTCVVLSVVIVSLFKENKALSQKLMDQAVERLNDVKELKDEYFKQLDQFKQAYLTAQESTRHLTESVLQIVQNLQQVFNEGRRKS